MANTKYTDVSTSRICPNCLKPFEAAALRAAASEVARRKVIYCCRDCYRTMPPNPEPCFWAKVDKTSHPGGCWLWTGAKSTAGYGQLRFKGKTYIASRLSYQFNVGSIPAGMFVCHRCDNPPCVNPTHLFLGTHTDNMHDCSLKGRCLSPRGEAHLKAVLTENQVSAIRTEFARGGITKAALARKYGVSPTAISGLILHKTWRHVT